MTNLDYNTAAIILSGGAGSRFGGLDKGLQPYHGKALVEHVIAVIEPQVDTVYLCVNRNLERYRSLGFALHSDEYDSYQGPMSGISSVLRGAIILSSAEQVLISSCDVPHLPNDIRDRLQSGLEGTVGSDVAIAHDGNRRQNLHCLIKRPVWQSLIDFFDAGGRAMHRWFDEVDTINVDFSNAANSFLNINTAAQLSQPKN